VKPPLNIQAAQLIRSLLVQGRFSDHVLNPGKGDDTIVASEVVTQLEASKVGDGTPDAALAIGKHAFRAGFAAGKFGINYVNRENPFSHLGAPEVDAAWSDYNPPEDIKALS
jgi:hypothetical protein